MKSVRITLITLLFVGVVNAQELPKAATEQPLAVEQSDVQAVMGPLNQEQAYLSAIALLQKEADAMHAQAQRSFNIAQAKHPDMPIDMKTWTYTKK